MPPPDIDVNDAIAYLKAAGFERRDGAVAPLEPGPATATFTDVDGNEGEMELDAESMPVLRDMGNGLLCSYVVDVGPQFEFVQHHHLAEQGVTANELHGIGLRNLLNTVADSLQISRFAHACVVVCGGNFEASLVLVDSLWDTLFTDFVGSSIAVAIPARDVLVFCDSCDANGIAELRDVIERVWPLDDHILTRNVYVRVDRAWEVLEQVKGVV